MSKQLIYLGKISSLVVTKDKFQIVVNSQLVGYVNPKNVILKDNGFYIDLNHILAPYSFKKLLSKVNKASSKHIMKYIGKDGNKINKLVGASFKA